MADAKTLSKFSIARKGEAYSLHIEDDAGEIIEFDASLEQLDLIAEVLDGMLDEDDATDEVDGEEED